MSLTALLVAAVSRGEDDRFRSKDNSLSSGVHSCVSVTDGRFTERSGRSRSTGGRMVEARLRSKMARASKHTAMMENPATKTVDVMLRLHGPSEETSMPVGIGVRQHVHAQECMD